MSEKWKPIKNHEKDYSVSNYGNVKNNITNNVLTGDLNSIGYRRVILYNPVKKRYFIHRLVASHFCEGEEDDLVVNHISGKKLDNHCNNLEWVTRSQNDIHAFKNNLRSVNGEVEVLQICPNTKEVLRKFDSITNAANYVGGKKPSNISSVCSGRRDSAYGFYWRYA